ncbi:MAG TPA: DUF2752 domain-containing protein [Acidobacteriota bacterium]|nr:DUF2752 domain-containing protein [Acidobacteriota bacterium]
MSDRILGAIVALLVLVASLVFTPATLPGFDLCWFHRMTGLPCAGCGITRSICCISHLDFARAWSFNPFGYFVYVAAIYLLFRPLTIQYCPNLEKAFSNTKLRWAFPLCVVVCFLLFGLWRIIRIVTSS